MKIKYFTFLLLYGETMGETPPVRRFAQVTVFQRNKEKTLA